MKSPSSRLKSLQKRIIVRYPGLAKYLFLFRVDRWLIPVLGLAMLGSVLGVGSFLKLWTNTPEGFEPVVKVSVFDLLQAKALTQNALKHEASGHVVAAKAAWRGVIGNTPGRVEPLRRYLEILQQEETDRSAAREIFRYADWLLRLTEYDPGDVELVARALEHSRRYTEVLRLVNSRDELSTGSEAAALRALFWLGHHDVFGKKWETAAPDLRSASLMELFAQAHRVVSEAALEDYQAFLNRLAEVEPYTAAFLPAQRLAIRVHAALGRAGACRRVLEDLEKRRLVSFSDYLPYWQLLIEQGQSGDIFRQYAQVGQPVTEFEGYSLVELLRSADRVDEALKVSSGLLEHFGNPVSLWLDHGNLLMEHQRWHELKSVAMNVHQSDRLSHLWSTAKYWEGLAELFLEETELAEENFAEIADHPILSPATSLELVNRLRHLGQKKAAYKVLNQLEEVLAEDPNYWVIRCQIAAADKDLEALVESATKAYERSPDDIGNRNNYAVALLLQRQDPEKAVELGRGILKEAPDSIVYKLTLIHALIQGNRLSEAQRMLESLEGEKVATADIFADYRLALLELAYAQQRFTDVLAFRAGLDLSAFMPEKVEWIEAAVAEARKHG